MSDVLIKGIEMPKNCKECPFSDHIAWCLIPGDWRERYYMPTESERSKYCPLKEVSTPHGRLIDGDETLRKLLGFNDGWFSSKGIKDIGYSTEEVIKNMPTIIPASN